MFNTICYWLNVVGWSWLVVGVRFGLHRLLARWSYEFHYDKPENIGYAGWVEVQRIGPVAFRRLDGTLQYRW